MTHRSSRLRSAAACVATLTAWAAIGCGPHLRTPRWFDPGNAASQRYEAIYHDPYPLNDVGPEIVGGRPRGYQAPVPEVARGRLQSEADSAKRTVAPPPATRFTP